MKKTQSTLFTAKRIAVAVAAVCATLSMPAFAADDMKGLMDLLLKKGVITQAEYDQNIKAAQDAAENREFKEKRIDADVGKTNKYMEKRAKDGSVKENGLGFKSADGNSEINLTGRLHFDARSFSNDFGISSDRDGGSMGDRFSVRRARIGVTGILNKDIAFELITNTVGSNSNLLDTAWANYSIDPAFQIRVGKFKQPFGLETLTSSNNIDLMERSYQDQLAPGKQLGVMAHGELKGVNYAASIYQTGFDVTNNTNGLGPEAAMRLTSDIAKVFSLGDDLVLHVGLAGTSGKQNITPTTSSQNGGTLETKGAFIAFNDENAGLKNVFRTRIYGAPPCSTVKSDACVGGYSLAASDAANVKKSLLGLELALAYSATKFQYEYSTARFNASSYAYDAALTNAGTATAADYYKTSSSGKVITSYAEIIHNLTGESWAPAYKGGTFSAIKPNSPFSFSKGGLGAWQMVVRYSKYDASSFGALNSDGKETKFSNSDGNQYSIEGSPTGNTITYGVNWIMNPNARIMLNYSMSKFGSSFVPTDVGTNVSPTVKANTENVLSIRSQFSF